MNEQNMAVKTGFGIDLQKLLRTYLRRWWLIALATVVMTVGSWFYTTNYIKPVYRASASIYVNSVKVPQNQQLGSISSGALATSQRLVMTYVSMVSSDVVLDKAVEELNDGITVEELRKIVSASQIDETETFRVIVNHSEPEYAAYVANVVADVAQREISGVVEGSSAKVYDEAKVPKSPASPSLIKNVLLGAILGICSSVTVLTLQFLLDVRIKEESDLYALFNLPVLGQIPEFDSAAEKKGKKHEKKESKRK